MSDQTGPVDQPTNASGSGDELADQRPSYDSYQKILSEKKRERDRAKALESELNELKNRLLLDEEKRLEEQEQFKELYGKTKQQLEEREKQLTQIQQAQLDAKKMRSFLDAVKADVPKQYWGLVDLEQIALDGDQIDEFSVQKYVEAFRQTYPDVVKPRETRRLPSDSPDPHSQSTLTYEQWLQLPLKEQKARFQEMRRNDTK